ncbi:MAG: DUF2946 family protein [Steroidobacter sp.]
MDDWVLKALQRWPNVPALFGWLGLDRRGRWLIQGETISHARIVETINRNYGVDAHGRWYFQNGPQRGYIQLASTPLILFVAEDQSGLITHNQLPVTRVDDAHLDEEGALVLLTEHGAGELIGSDLPWALERMSSHNRAIDDDTLSAALALPSGSQTNITLSFASTTLPLRRLDFADMPATLAFERQPTPREGEKTATKAMD